MGQCGKLFEIGKPSRRLAPVYAPVANSGKVHGLMQDFQRGKRTIVAPTIDNPFERRIISPGDIAVAWFTLGTRQLEARYFLQPRQQPGLKLHLGGIVQEGEL